MSRKGGRSAAIGAAIISAAVALSRVLGLVREMVFAALFGAGGVMAAFTVAFRIPNLLRDLFAEGALSTAFVTTFSKEIELRGEAAAWSLANKVRSLLVVFMAVATVLGMIFAPLLVRFLAPGFDAPTQEMTTLLTRIMFPFIGMVSMAALVMGMLNANKSFTMPALASCFFNVGSIIGGLLFAWLIDPTFGPLSIVGMAIGTLIGGFLQLAVQLPALHALGYRAKSDFDWKDPGVRYVLQLMGPAVIAASAVQVNVMVNTIFASWVSEEAVNWLNYAFRLMQLPLGMFGVAIATVTLPLIARGVAAGDHAGVRQTLARGVRFALFLTIPSAIGLVLLGNRIVSLLYERGRFTPQDVIETGAALSFYAIGLLGYASLKVVTPAFYAMDRRFIPMIVGIASIVLNVVLNMVFTFSLGMGHRGLALSTGILAVVNFLVLYVWMGKLMNGFETRRLISGLARIAVAACLLALVCVAGEHFVLAPLAENGVVTRAFALVGVISAGGAVFLVTCIALRLEETREAIDLISRRLTRKKTG